MGRSFYGRWMADDFSERYGDLLIGSYDCVDRIVLNAYYPLGHAPGGFREWWRRLHDDSEEQLDDNHLMRMAGDPPLVPRSTRRTPNQPDPGRVNMTNDNLVPRIRAAHDGVEPSAAFRSRAEAQLRGRSMTKYQRRRWFPYAIAAAVAATAVIVAIITANTKPGINANTQKPTVVSHTASSGARIVPSDIEGAWTLISVVEGQQRLSATGYQTVLELTPSAFRFTTKCAMTTGPYDLRGDSITFRGDTAASGCIESRKPDRGKTS